jgi:hypothetical protein
VPDHLPHPSRRALVRSLAWSVPVVVSSAVVPPAAAASSGTAASTIDLGGTRPVDVAGDWWFRLDGVLVALVGVSGDLSLGFTFHADDPARAFDLFATPSQPPGWVAPIGIEDTIVYAWHAQVDSTVSPEVVAVGDGDYFLLVDEHTSSSAFSPGTLTATAYVDGVQVAMASRHFASATPPGGGSPPAGTLSITPGRTHVPMPAAGQLATIVFNRALNTVPDGLVEPDDLQVDVLFVAADTTQRFQVVDELEMPGWTSVTGRGTFDRGQWTYPWLVDAQADAQTIGLTDGAYASLWNATQGGPILTEGTLVLQLRYRGALQDQALVPVWTL